MKFTDIKITKQQITFLKNYYFSLSTVLKGGTASVASLKKSLKI